MWRIAVSVWVCTNSTNESTSNTARAVSSTCQTTTAAISIGLPSRSLTFSTSLSWLRIRVETVRRVVSGLTQRSPARRTVPV
jgi:hypothetical protein